jgi:hypothetical protein
MDSEFNLSESMSVIPERFYRESRLIGHSTLDSGTSYF